MNAVEFDPGAALALAAALLVLLAALAIARARSMLAIALMLAALGGALALALLALDAPDLALAEALVGVGFTPLLVIGAMLLTAPSARTQAGRVRLGALGAAAAVGAALLWATPDLPAFGTGGQGRTYVNRASFEIGARNAVAVVAGDYRAIDSLAQVVALMTGALGAFALLGFGERAGETPPQTPARTQPQTRLEQEGRGP